MPCIDPPRISRAEKSLKALVPYSSVSGNWRLVFEFEGSNVTNVDLVDYH